MNQPAITGTTHTLPFDRLSARDFERLCLWLVEREGYERAEHIGAAGSEEGRDIIAWREGVQWTFQCKRVQRFGPRDVLAEVEKVLALPKDQRPAGSVFLVTCDVSANARQQARRRCGKEIECHFWSGTELDEKVKRHPDIMQEFFQSAARSSSYTTQIGHAIGPVHTGSGDIHVHLAFSEQTPSAQTPLSPSTPASSYLPPKAYHRLIGRFDELDQVMGALRDPEGKPMIAMVGLGGIGKTALAHEAVERGLDEQLFEHVVWTSAKTEHFVGEVAIKSGVADYNFDTLLSDIGRQCDRLDIPQMPATQKQTVVKYLLAKKRVLVVMDNLETVPESDKLVHEVFQILGKSKLLVTSRHRIKHEQVFSINLSGFPEDEGVTFLREESKERGIEEVAQASRENLATIHRVTGGAPLAMKLVVGQISRQPMDMVLDTLKQASFKGQDYPFYRFVYQYSWDILDMNAHMALVDMSVFPAVTGGTVHDVQAVSQLESPAFWPAMDQLVIMSLVDKIGPTGQERFALHPLTQYFIKSDITKEWADR